MTATLAPAPESTKTSGRPRPKIGDTRPSSTPAIRPHFARERAKRKGAATYRPTSMTTTSDTPDPILYLAPRPIQRVAILGTPSQPWGPDYGTIYIHPTSETEDLDAKPARGLRRFFRRARKVGRSV